MTSTETSVPPPATEPDAGRAMLRHAVATLAYRGSKSLRDAPDGFGAFSVADESRTPLQILAHLGDLLDWSLWIARGDPGRAIAAIADWDRQVERFYGGLAAFDAYLASGAPLRMSAERLFQGPVADALTHVGQLNLLRRLAGAPVPAESYAKAEIAAGRVGPEQSGVRAELGR